MTDHDLDFAVNRAACALLAVEAVERRRTREGDTPAVREAERVRGCEFGAAVGALHRAAGPGGFDAACGLVLDQAAFLWTLVDLTHPEALAA